MHNTKEKERNSDKSWTTPTMIRKIAHTCSDSTDGYTPAHIVGVPAAKKQRHQATTPHTQLHPMEINELSCKPSEPIKLSESYQDLLQQGWLTLKDSRETERNSVIPSPNSAATSNPERITWSHPRASKTKNHVLEGVTELGDEEVCWRIEWWMGITQTAMAAGKRRGMVMGPLRKISQYTCPGPNPPSTWTLELPGAAPPSIWGFVLHTCRPWVADPRRGVHG